MKFIHFGLRMEIERQYLDWCENEGIANEPNSFVVFMMEKGWLNEEKIIGDLKEPKTEPTISKMEQVDKDINVRSKDEPQTDCAWR